MWQWVPRVICQQRNENTYLFLLTKLWSSPLPTACCHTAPTRRWGHHELHRDENQCFEDAASSIATSTNVELLGASCWQPISWPRAQSPSCHQLWTRMWVVGRSSVDFDRTRMDSTSVPHLRSWLETLPCPCGRMGQILVNEILAAKLVIAELLAATS